MQYILLIAGFVLLVKGADWLVDGATSVGRRLHISDLVIGLTVVAFGTSTPELFVNLIASLHGNAAIAIGNVVGSNIANVFLILGIASVIYPLAVGKGTVWKEIPLGLLAVLALGIMANDRFLDGAEHSVLTRIDGLVLLCFFVIFLCYTAGIAKRIEGMEEVVPQKHLRLPKSILFIAAGLAGLILGSRWVVSSAVYIADQAGVSESLIGLTIVAVGTSLPELATSAVAAYKKNVEIAVGNVVGSNIFNIFFILGVSSVVKPLPFSTTNNVDISMAILAGLLLFVCMFTGRKRLLDRWEGVVFLAIYAGYIAYLIHKG
jgi:cation:H+ antiporter